MNTGIFYDKKNKSNYSISTYIPEAKPTNAKMYKFVTATNDYNELGMNKVSFIYSQDDFYNSGIAVPIPSNSEINKYKYFRPSDLESNFIFDDYNNDAGIKILTPTERLEKVFY